MLGRAQESAVYVSRAGMGQEGRIPRGRSRHLGQKEQEEITTSHWGKQGYFRGHSVAAGYGQTDSVGTGDVELAVQRETGWVSAVTHLCLSPNAEWNACHCWHLRNIMSVG